MSNRCFTVLMVLLLGSCSPNPEEDVNLRLTLQERQRIDTIVTRELRMMRPYLDSLCTAEFDDRVAEATDSIVQRRLEEELRLRSRLPQPKTGTDG